MHLKFRLGPVAAPFGRNVLQSHGLGNDLPGLPLGIQAGIGILKNNLPGRLQIGPVFPKDPGIRGFDAIEKNFPGGGPVHVHHAPGKGGFSRPGFPHQPENLPPAQGKGHVVQGREAFPAINGKFMGQMGDFQQIFRHFSSPFFSALGSKSQVAAAWVGVMENMGGASS